MNDKPISNPDCPHCARKDQVIKSTFGLLQHTLIEITDHLQEEGLLDIIKDIEDQISKNPNIEDDKLPDIDPRDGILLGLYSILSLLLNTNMIEVAKISDLIKSLIELKQKYDLVPPEGVTWQ